jgi:hypothetical protein
MKDTEPALIHRGYRMQDTIIYLASFLKSLTHHLPPQDIILPSKPHPL